MQRGQPLFRLHSPVCFPRVCVQAVTLLVLDNAGVSVADAFSLVARWRASVGADFKLLEDRGSVAAAPRALPPLPIRAVWDRDVEPDLTADLTDERRPTDLGQPLPSQVLTGP